MKLRIFSIVAAATVALSMLTSAPAQASQNPVPAKESETNSVGFIVKLKPGIAAIAPNGEPTGENYAGVDLENSRAIGGGYTAVSFAENLSSNEITAAKERLALDPRVESVELDQFVENANYRALPIAPLIFNSGDPIQLPVILKTAVRLPSMPVVTATDAWVSGTTERIRVGWSKPTGSYSGYIVGYRVQLYASGAWRTIKSQTYASTRSHTTTSSYLKAGTSTAFRVAALIRSGGRTYLGYYKKVYATPTTTPQSYSKLTLRNNVTELAASWTLLSTSQSRGGLDVSYNLTISKPDGTQVACQAVTETSCSVSDVTSGTRYTGRLVVTNSRGSASTPALSITFTTAAAIASSDDSQFSKQWYLKSSNRYSLNAEEAWLTETGLESVVVAVLDTGITVHPDLPWNDSAATSQIIDGYDMVSSATASYDGNGRDADPSDPGDYYGNDDSSWHGTHVSGIIAAADNGQGGIGIAPHVKVLPVRVLSSQGGTTSDIVAGINWAIGVPISGIPTNTNIADVINMSIGGQGTCRASYQELLKDPNAKSATEKALIAAKSKGITVVTAAGNDNDLANNSYPGNCYPTINVGATGSQGKATFYSNFSDSQNIGVDISAPGGDYCEVGSTGQIYSTMNDGTRSPGSAIYGYSIGTSMAAPMVAGTVALMYSAKFRQDPTFSPSSSFVEKVWDAIRTTKKDFSSTAPTTCGAASVKNGFNYGGYGAGIIDAKAAVAAILTQ